MFVYLYLCFKLFPYRFNLSLSAMDLDKNYGFSLKYQLDVVSQRKNFTENKRVIAIGFSSKKRGITH